MLKVIKANIIIISRTLVVTNRLIAEYLVLVWSLLTFADITERKYYSLLVTNRDVQGSCRDVTSDPRLKSSTNFPCLPRETGKARTLEINPREEEKLSNEYMQEKILHSNRYYTETENNTLP